MAGDTVFFDVEVRDASGAAVNRSIAWSTNGGAINENGVYQASGGPGTYAVIASEPAGVSDSATIFVVESQESVARIGAAVQLEAFIDDATVEFDWQRWEVATSLMVEGKVRWVRLVFDWRWIEPSQGSFLWNGRAFPYDSVVADLRRKGINILGLVLHAPEWASGHSEGVYPPTDLTDFSAFVLKLVERFRGQVSHWEIWNEPNIEEFWRPLPSVQDYTQLLAAGYLAAKTADPACTVISAGLAHSPDILEWFQAMYDSEAGLTGISDGIGLHAYTWNGKGPLEAGPGSFAVVDSVYAVVVSNGDSDKRIWLTEQGWKANAVGEALQAQYLEQSIEIVNSRGFIGAYFWFEFVDQAASFGLLRSNLARRPSFLSFSKQP